MLFFSHQCQNLCEKYCDNTDHYKENDLSTGREKYSRESEDGREREDDCADLLLRESEFHEPEVQMGGLFSLEGILALHDATRHHIDKVDKVDPEN